METREKSAFFEEIAQKLIDTAPELAYIKNSQVRIVYLVSNQAKKAGAKVVHGECEKIPAKYRWAIPADFSITYNDPQFLEGRQPHS